VASTRRKPRESKRGRLYRDLGMSARPDQHSALHAHDLITKSGAFCGAADDTDGKGHDAHPETLV